EITGHSQRSMVNDEQSRAPTLAATPNFLPPRSRCHGARNRKILRMPWVLAQPSKSVPRIVDRSLRRVLDLDRSERNVVDRFTSGTTEDDQHVGSPPAPTTRLFVDQYSSLATIHVAEPM